MEHTLRKSGLKAALLLSLIAAMPLVAGPLDVPPEYAQFGALESPLTVDQMIEISLAFSGVSSAEREPFRRYLEQLILKASESIGSEEDRYRAGEMLLEFLHEQVLVTYSEPQTRLDVLIENGVYNCVSSAILYYLLARSFDLAVFSVVTPDHAFCGLDIDGRKVDVETTTVHGYDPGRRKEFRDSFGNTTGFTYVPPTNYRDRSEAGDKELLSLILYNRISAYDARGTFEEALGASLRRHAFLGTDAAFSDVVREIGNYLAALNRDSRYDEALAFIAEVSLRYGRIDELVDTYYGVLYNRVVTYLAESEFERAKSLLKDPRALENLGSARLLELEALVVRRELAEVLPGLGLDEGFVVLDRLRRDSNVSGAVFHDFEVLLYSRQAEKVAEKAGFLAAVTAIDSAISVVGSDPRLERAREVYLYNFSAEVHNRFAELFNAGMFDRALAIVSEAIEIVPGSTILAKDLRMLNRVMAATSD